MIRSKISVKLFLMVLLVSAPLFVSCKDKETTPAEDVTQQSQEQTLEQKKQILQNVAPTNTTNSVNNTGNLAVNPPHGQPGHICEIPVGAPLKGPATGNTNGTPTATSGEGVKLNPAHGLPGHRCDIKVGDPLPI